MNSMTMIDAGGIDPLDLSRREFSDLGNAERLEARFQGTLAHVPEWGWLAFDGTRWAVRDGPARAMRATHAVVQGLRGEAKALLAAIQSPSPPDWVGKHRDFANDRLKGLYRWQATSGNASRCKGMLEQASALLGAEPDDFDRDPLAINCLNGTLRLTPPDGPEAPATVRCDPHDAADRITRRCEVEWDPEAPCPAWDKHLATVLPDAEVRAFFQRCMGYALTGSTVEQAMLMLQGRGGDGKSTTMDVVREIMGDYATAADVNSFMAAQARSGEGPTPDLARLAGDVRLCSTSEPRRGGALDENKIKAITGGSPMVARKLHGDPFEFLPRFLLVIECNAKPRISGDDDGIWRRVMVILFPHQFGKDGAAVDKSAKAKLLAERAGVFRWLVEGALAWLERGALDPPAAVLDAVEEYRRQASPFGNWFEERVDTSDPNALIEGGALKKDFDDWCEENGIGDRERMTAQAFGRALSDRQINQGPRAADGKKRRRGVRLRPVGWMAAASTPSPPDDDPVLQDFVP